MLKVPTGVGPPRLEQRDTFKGRAVALTMLVKITIEGLGAETHETRI